MAADGSIVIVADVDDKKAQAELNRLAKKIDDLNAKIKQAETDRIPWLQQAEELGVKLDEAKAKLEAMRAAPGGYTSEQIAEQAETVKSLQAQWDAAQKKVEGYNRAIERSQSQLSAAEERAGELAEQLSGVGKAGASALDGVNARLAKFERRIIGLAKRVFVFSLITTALRGLRKWLGNAVKSNNEAAAAIARLRGALLTLAQPILQVVIPAFITLVNVITRVVTAIASVFAQLSGKTLQQSADAAKNLYNEQKAINGVGGAAKKASKSLASFDEINKLAEEDAAGDGGAGGGADIAPTFDFGNVDTTMLDTILKAAEAIGLAFLSWKLSDSFLGTLKTFLGLLIAIKGAIILAQGIFEAWVNGVTWDNLGKSIGGLALLVGGLALAFGTTGAAIGLVVGGAALLITAIKDILENGLNLENGLMAVIGILAVCAGVALKVGAGFGVVAASAAVIAFGLAALVIGFKDAIENGWNLYNTLTALAGIILTGLGISLLTGSWIPALIAGILGVLFAITTLTGNGDQLIENLKQVFKGLNDFISGVFTGDWEKAWNGVKEIFKGVFNAIATLFGSTVNAIIKGLNWLISKINKINVTVPDWVPEIGGKKIGVNIQPITEWKIPQLAQGAVIPPNREFMAVLGDQRSGNNIEAPEELIRKIVREEAGGNYGEILRQILRAIQDGKVLAVDGLTFGRLVHQYGRAESARVGASLVNGGNV